MAGRKRTLKSLAPQSLIILLFIAYSLGTSACLQSIRRPTSTQPTWVEHTAPKRPVGVAPVKPVQSDSTSNPVDTVAIVTSDSTSKMNILSRPVKSAEKSNITLLASLKPASAADSNQPATNTAIPKQQYGSIKNARQINAYALWCIENDMWKEAQLHLEHALEQDNLPASFHNNLGIIYEQLGKPKKALKAYQQARALQPDREAYTINLERLESHQQNQVNKAADSLQTVPNDVPKDPNVDGTETSIDSFKDAIFDVSTPSLTTE